MFNKNKFALILKNISDTYPNQRDFSSKSKINRTYLSMYMNMKIDKPPKPVILERLAASSNGVTSYGELLQVCGYLDEPNTAVYDFASITDKKILDAAILYSLKNKLTDKDIESDSYIKVLLSDLNSIDRTKAVEQIRIQINKGNLIYGINPTVNSNVFPITDVPKKIPVVGKISAGLPILAVENIEGYEFAPSSLIKQGYDYFYLYVQGDSMNLKFNDGDIVLVQQQPDLENDEIGVILIDGQDATVKKFRKENGLVILEPMSTNSEHHTQIYNPKDISVKIIGKVVSYQGKV